MTSTIGAYEAVIIKLVEEQMMKKGKLVQINIRYKDSQEVRPEGFPDIGDHEIQINCDFQKDRFIITNFIAQAEL